MALARLSRVCSPDDSTPALAFLQPRQIELFDQFVQAPLEIGDAIDHAEHFEVLLDGEIAGQRAVDGGEVGVGERAAAAPEQIDAFDLDAPRARLQHAERHVDRRRLARAVGAEQADDLARRHLEADVVDGLERAKGFAQALDEENGRVVGHRVSLARRSAARTPKRRRTFLMPALCAEAAFPLEPLSRPSDNARRRQWLGDRAYGRRVVEKKPDFWLRLMGGRDERRTHRAGRARMGAGDRRQPRRKRRRGLDRPLIGDIRRPEGRIGCVRWKARSGASRAPRR